MVAALLLLGCQGDAPWVVTPTDPLPAVAPAVVLLATLEPDGDVTIGGAIQGELWVDVDEADDRTDGFRYVVEAADGTPLYARSTPGPLIVRDFLAYWGEQSGYDLLTLLPDLGRFPIQVPLLDGATAVDLQVRDPSGGYTSVGRYTLDRVGEDDQGVSEAVVGQETLFDAGPPEDRLDLVLVGDGYTVDEMDQWRADAAAWAEDLLATEPFASFPDRVNVHRVDVVSNESGVSYDCTDACTLRDTALETVFPLEVVNAVTGANYRTTAVFQLDQWEVARVASVVPWDFVGVVANTTHDGGFAVHYATITPARGNWPEAGVHELGHLIGLLGDEYDVDDCIRSDALGLPVNITDDREAPPWMHWVEEGTPLPTPDERAWNDVVGAFAPAYNCEDLYRPAASCRMLSSDGDPFCPVCSEQIVRRLFRYGDPAEGLESAVHGGRVDLALRNPLDGVTAAWTVDGALQAETGPALRLTREALGAGSHTVSVTATVATSWVRVGAPTQTWSVRLE